VRRLALNVHHSCCIIKGVETSYTQTSVLRRLRQDAGLSMMEVSRRTGIDPAQLSRFESGRMLPTIPRLRQLGALYGVTSWKILQLMEREEEEL
jgi:transcriptional regulator with XRE-family HTH domain